jgi:hypothetical protein
MNGDSYFYIRPDIDTGCGSHRGFQLNSKQFGNLRHKQFTKLSHEPNFKINPQTTLHKFKHLEKTVRNKKKIVPRRRAD